jgi:adenosylmethionine-8-amino-7-oxononanoate aminotransferase
MMCAAGLAAVRYLKAHNLTARCREMGQVFHRKLARFANHPLVGDIRGRGLLAGLELVADRDTKRPFPRSAKLAERVGDAAQDEGLVVWLNAGTALDNDGDVICLAPPFVVTDAEMDEMLDRLGRALDRGQAAVG